MQEFAKSKGMEVIPLVQTFGHMEVKLTPCSLVYNYCKKKKWLEIPNFKDGVQY